MRSDTVIFDIPSFRSCDDRPSMRTGRPLRKLPASERAVVKPERVGQGLTTARSDAYRFMRRLDGPELTALAKPSSKWQNEIAPPNFQLKLSRRRSMARS